MTRPWFWIVVLCIAWSVPLIKSLGAEYPDPPAGVERAAEIVALNDADGLPVTLANLKGHLVVVHSLDLAQPQATEADFVAFREMRDRLRGLGSSVVHIILCAGGDAEQVVALIDSKTARRPGNLFLLDPGWKTRTRLRTGCANEEPALILLDRHGRRRGDFVRSPEDLDRFAQTISLLANWLGSDPEPGTAIHR
ncbi:MAG: hypothetical protein ABGY71_00275 [bacterium]|nr:hypothetical protein [Planctomycetota bacterium]HIL52822.1 hypothetical protein [Planctomycetota bacterium]